MQRLLRLKLVFWLGWLWTLIQMMALLVTGSISYLAQVFLGFVLVTTRVIIEGSVDQVYIRGRDTGCCTTWPSVLTIAPSFTRVLNKRLGACF